MFADRMEWIRICFISECRSRPVHIGQEEKKTSDGNHQRFSRGGEIRTHDFLLPKQAR
jgi:hypothetical protein